MNGTVLIIGILLVIAYAFSNDPYKPEKKKGKIIVKKPVEKRYKPQQFIEVSDDQLN